MREPRWSISTLIVLVIAALPFNAAAQSWQTLIDDEFIGPDGTNLSAHAPETNVPAGAWSLGGSPALVLQGQAVRPSGSGPFQAFATIDARVSDGDIGLYWYAVPQGDNSQLAGGLIFRYVDPNNFMLVHYWQQRVWLWKMVAGSFVHIALADVAPPQGAWHWMAVRAIGSSLAVNWDGVDVIVVNESTYQTATRHGVWFRNVADPYSYVGTFRVRSQQQMLPPPVTSVSANPNPLSMPIASTQVVTATGYSATGVAVQSATFTWASSNSNIAWIQTTTQNTAKIVARGVGSASLTATEAGGVSRSIPVTVTNTTQQQKQVLINDEFIAPEGSGLTSHLPETNLSGGSWSLGGSPGIVVHNQAVHPSGLGASDSFATIDSLASDADVGVYWLPNPTGDPSTLAGGVIFRYASPTSYLLLHYYQEKLWLWKMTPSGFVHLAEASVPPPNNAWHWMEITGVGSTISAYWDGVGKFQVNDATNIFSTRHGIWFRSVIDYGSVIGTFTVKGTLPEPITSVTVTPTSLSLPVNGAKFVTAAAYSASNTYQPANFTWSSSNTSIASIGTTTFNTAKIVGESVGTATITATAPNGVSTSLEVTVIDKCLGLCVFDSFTGSGSLETHGPDTNMMDTPWVVTGGPTVALHTDKIRPTANGFTLSLATIEGGNSNGTVRADWIPPAPGVSPSPNFGLLARYVSDDEYFVATYENGHVNLHRRYPGGIALIGSATVDGSLSANHTMQVRLDGPGIQVWWDGAQSIQAIDSAYIGATRHGVYTNVANDPFSYIDNFMFIGAEISVPVVMKVTSSGNAVAQGFPLSLSAHAFTASNVWIPWTSFTWHSSNSAVAIVESLDHASARVVGLASGTAIITATSAEGLTATTYVLVTIPESDGTVRVFDSFDGPIATFLSSHQPNRYITGAAWSTNGPGNIRIDDRNTIYPLRHLEVEYGTIESGTANGTVSAVWAPRNANVYANGGLIFRYVNDNSYWYAILFGRSLQLKKVTGNAPPTTVASVGQLDPTNAYHQLAVLLDGPRIQVWWNGVQQIAVTDSMNESATRHGVFWHSEYNAESWIDNFSVNTEFITPARPEQPVFPCVNGVWPPSGQYWPTVGGTDTVTLSAPFGCAWQAQATVPWIHLTTLSGVGDAYVEYSVELNTGGERYGAIVFDNSGWSYPIIQAAGGELTMTFDVRNSATQNPVAGAKVALTPNHGGVEPLATDANGLVTYVVGGGVLNFTVSKAGYITKSDSVNVTQADTRTIWIDPAPGEPGPGSDPPEICAFTFSIHGETETAARVSFTTGETCEWTASALSDGMEATPTSGIGSGFVIVTIGESADSSRTYLLQVGGYQLAISNPLREVNGPQGWCIENFCIPDIRILPPILGGAERNRKPPELIGPAVVVRGQTAAWYIENYRGGAISGWRFRASDDGALTFNLHSPTGPLWGGRMVTSGTISVTVVKDERTYNFSRDIVVVPRAGWFTGTPSAQPVNNGHNDKLHVPDPPKSGDILGINQVIIQPGYEVAYIDFGPNHGYSFVSRVNVGIASYRWTASPTILLMDPQFVAANCGSYPANPFGFATAAEIRDDVVRHESGLVESHYINFVTAMNAPRLNPEAVLEPLVRKETPARYRIDVRIAVENAATGIVAITGTEPCGGAPGVRNGACQFLGNRNLWPYPQTCP